MLRTLIISLCSLLAAILVAMTLAQCERHPPADTFKAAPAPASSAAEEPAPVTVKVSEAPVACPQNMVLVEGDYCEGVTHVCLESKPGNGCIRFKPGSAQCVGKVEHLKFCIDKYEWPNQLGAKPTLMQSWEDAQAKCSSAGKRLCGDDEWTQACEGPQRLPYPYGWARDKTACNIDNKWIKWNNDLFSSNSQKVEAELRRLDKTQSSGGYARCVSPYGAYDMTGNADEWTVNVTGNGKPYKSYLKGGHWVGGVRNRCRPATVSHNETDRFYDFGFRCCKSQK